MPLPDRTLILAPGLLAERERGHLHGLGRQRPVAQRHLRRRSAAVPRRCGRSPRSAAPQDQVVAVSPDGSRIAFVRSVGGDAAGPLFTVNADGLDEQQVSPTEALVSPAGGWGGSPATWSPDGSQLAFAATVGDCACTVYVVDADGGKPEADLRRAGPDLRCALVSGRAVDRLRVARRVRHLGPGHAHPPRWHRPQGDHHRRTRRADHGARNGRPTAAGWSSRRQQRRRPRRPVDLQRRRLGPRRS